MSLENASNMVLIRPRRGSGGPGKRRGLRFMGRWKDIYIYFFFCAFLSRSDLGSRSKSEHTFTFGFAHRARAVFRSFCFSFIRHKGKWGGGEEEADGGDNHAENDTYDNNVM